MARRYWIVLILAVLAAGGYLALRQVQAAHARSQGKTQAAYDAHLAAQQASASAFLRRIVVPSSFKQPPPSNGCQSGLLERCFSSSQPPAQAMQAALRAVQPLGLTVRKLACVDPSPLNTLAGRTFKAPWTPCSAQFDAVSAPGFSIVAFPMRAKKQVPGTPLAFNGTVVSFSSYVD